MDSAKSHVTTMLLMLILLTWVETPVKAQDKALITSYFPGYYVSHLQIFQGDVTQFKDVNPSFTLHGFTDDYVLITSLQADPSTTSLYFYEARQNTIYRINNFNIHLNHTDTSLSAFFTGISRATVTIALDHVHQNIYWTDPLNHQINMKGVNVSDEDVYQTIIKDTVEYPVAIAVDPKAGYLFFGNWPDSGTRLERSAMNGQKRETIISSNMGILDCLYADAEKTRLFWVDSYRRTVETANYYGQDRKVLRTIPEADITSIVVVEDTACIAGYSTYKIYCMDINTGTVSWDYEARNPPYGITAYDSSLQVTTKNKCDGLGCQYFCTLNEYNDAQCLCPNGMNLGQDGKSCGRTHELFERGILFANETHICMIEKESIATSKSPDIRCSSMAVKNVKYLAANVNESIVFYYNSEDKKIVKFDLKSFDHAIEYNYVVESISSMAYDWVENDMYITNPATKEISVVSMTTSQSGVNVLYRNINEPSEIIVEPHSKSLYWIARNSANVKTIYKGSMDGSPAVPFLKTTKTVNDPANLIFDYHNHGLTYVRRETQKLVSVNINGDEIRTYNVVIPPTSKVTLLQDHIYLNDTNVTLTAYLHILNNKVGTATVGSMNDFIIMDDRIQQAFQDPCKIMNGGCNQICRPEANGQHKCDCYFGYTLKENQTCSSTPLQQDFILMTDLDHDIVYQVSEKNGDIIALDLDEVSVPAMVRYDHINNYVYWCDVGSKQIIRQKLTSREMEVVFTTDSGYPDRLDFDFSQGMLYFTVAHHRTLGGFIGILNPAKPLEYYIIRSSLNYIGGIAVHPSLGSIFFTNVNSGGISYVGRVNMDGTDLQMLVNFTNAAQPYGIGIDFHERNPKIYYTVCHQDERIERCELNGTNKEVYVKAKDQYPIDVRVTYDHVYYVGYNIKKAMKIEKASKTPNNFMEMYAEIGKPDSIDVYQSFFQQSANAQCSLNNGGCSDFCLARKGASYPVCACPIGQNLLRDNKTCSDGTITCERDFPHGSVVSSCLAQSLSTCTYSCDSGYIASNSIHVLTCTNNGIWNVNLELLCTKPKCPMNFTHGMFFTECKNEAGNVCGFSCQDGYKTDSDVVTCTSSGQWSKNTNDLCVPIACPMEIVNGKFEERCSFRYKEHCTFICDKGYLSVNESQTLSCTAESIWDKNTHNLCKPLICPSQVTNGYIEHGCNFQYGTTCTYACYDDYINSQESSTLECTSDGSWNKNTTKLCKSRPKCQQNLTNGRFSTECDFNIGQSCHFNCSDGFEANQTTAQCLKNQTWSPSVDKICNRIIMCPMSKGSFSITSTCTATVGSKCDYFCTDGKVKNSNILTVSCTGAGAWDADLSTICIDPVCPKTIPNGQLYRECNAKAGDHCGFTCNAGYIKDNVNKILIACQSNQQWDTDPMKLCRNTVPCPPLPGNAVLSSNCNRVERENCSYICPSGQTKNLAKIMCGANGLWDFSKDNQLCYNGSQVPLNPLPRTDNLDSGSTSDKGLFFALGLIVTVAIFIIVLGALFFIFRKRILQQADASKTHGKFRASPNVYFNTERPLPQQTTTDREMPNTNPINMSQINLQDDSGQGNQTDENGLYSTVPRETSGPSRFTDAGISNPYYEAKNVVSEATYENDTIQTDDQKGTKPKKGNPYQRFD